jgi:hypothetical protein
MSLIKSTDVKADCGMEKDHELLERSIDTNPVALIPSNLSRTREWGFLSTLPYEVRICIYKYYIKGIKTRRSYQYDCPITFFDFTGGNPLSLMNCHPQIRAEFAQMLPVLQVISVKLGLCWHSDHNSKKFKSTQSWNRVTFLELMYTPIVSFTLFLRKGGANQVILVGS